VHRWGPRGGGGWAGGRPEAAVHVEVLTAARAKLIWWQRCESEVNGAGSGFGKLGGLVHSDWRWWLDQALARLGR
jgi:hypothetical protein